MKKQIDLIDRTIPYKVKVHHRAKQMTIALYYNGDVVVTIPRGWKLSMVEEFLKEKAQWVVGRLEHFKKMGIRPSHEDRLHFLAHKDGALTIARERLAYFNRFYGFTYGKITIRNQKRRWGSCSRNGNLSFNYKIALVPEEIADYVVVHELCHLKEFNHSRRFWKLIEHTVPHHRALRAAIRQKGLDYY